MLTLLQKEIEKLYQVDCEASIEAFLLDETMRKKYVASIPWLQNSDEALLVQENSESLDVGLLFPPALLQWSQRLDWPDLNFSHFEKLAPLVEGVSHFVYLLWRVSREEPVTQLELELQAEVDKFILFTQHGLAADREKIFSMLFLKKNWNPNLASIELERYELANHFASKYCHFLNHHYFQPGNEGDCYSEIRHFYRLPRSEKIRYLHA